jgi:hypothetical protein
MGATSRFDVRGLGLRRGEAVRSFLYTTSPAWTAGVGLVAGGGGQVGRCACGFAPSLPPMRAKNARSGPRFFGRVVGSSAPAGCPGLRPRL